MSAEKTTHIFAYGSNLHLQRMRARVPSAQPMEIGYVRQRRLMFHKRSVDGSAKADAAWSPRADDRVWGVIYRLPADEKPALDRCEYLGVGYDLEPVEVVAAR